MPYISEVIKQIILQLAGHCIRHADELVHYLMLWKPKNDIRNRRRRSNTFIDILKNDCECEEEYELRILMMDIE